MTFVQFALKKLNLSISDSECECKHFFIRMQKFKVCLIPNVIICIVTVISKTNTSF